MADTMKIKDIKDEKPKTAYYVVQFLERPYAYLGEFIYIPKQDILQAKDTGYIVFTYPIDPSMKNNEAHYDKWPYFLGKLHSATDSAQKAKDICKDLNSRKPDYEDGDLKDPEDNPADLEKNGKKRKAETKHTTNKKKLEETTTPKDIEVLDDDSMLTPDLLTTLTKQLESCEKQEQKLNEAIKLIHQKSCAFKEFIEKLKSYNNQDNTVDDTHEELLKIIKEQVKLIKELKLQLERKNGTDFANHKENSVTRWTLRYPKETNDAFELLAGSGVYINGVACYYIIRAAQTRTELARMFLHEIFIDKALKRGNFSSLDSHAINILVEASASITRHKGDRFEDVSKDKIVRSIRNRLFKKKPA
ncbi:uncharacterized protein LOC125063163 [Pieris napi]|uniref:uncharacterized protein LOC125063163 n=1 Tax=Pieris napi TaxID=78633 RepID=UPI001FBABA17|nr:uncharacterized protein LOC125063163 [Pieris napi]